MDPQKRILFYSQHVLGMGHFVRAMEIAKGLPDFRIRFLNGGMRVEGFPYPPRVELVNLPAVRPDAELKYIESTDPSRDLEDIKRSRWEALLSEFDEFDPDVLIVELFPFGRRQFVFELVPLLARTRQRRRSTKVVCSVRDILVTQPAHVHHEEWVCELLNRYFDLVLVHSDPSFQPLDETFSRVADIRTEIQYTGYVAQALDEPPAGMNGANGVHAPGMNGTRGARPRVGLPTIVVSVGGGRVGYELLSAAVNASRILERSQPHRMLVLSGPFLPEAQFAELEQLTTDRPHITLRRYTREFLSWLNDADLSISMAGYNTCMNVLTTGCRALVLPFATPTNKEQTLRAQKLEQLGHLQVIKPSELRPELLAEKIRASFGMDPPAHRLDTRGVERSAELITALTDARVGHAGNGHVARNGSGSYALRDALGPQATALRARLERAESEGRRIDVFLRDDDVGRDDRGLRPLLDLALARGVPLSLQIIPGVLSDSQTKLLYEYRHFSPTLLELNQHGWQHSNHEQNGSKSEFGFARGFDQQFADIARGKTILEQTFAERFHAVFTPPWNRCTEDTMRALDRLGFRVLSRSRGPADINGHAEKNGHAFHEIPITVDLFSRRIGPGLRPVGDILGDVLRQMDERLTIGLLLHHQILEADAFAFLESLLDELVRSPAVRFHTFRSLASHRAELQAVGGAGRDA